MDLTNINAFTLPLRSSLNTYSLLTSLENTKYPYSPEDYGAFVVRFIPLFFREPSLPRLTVNLISDIAFVILKQNGNSPIRSLEGKVLISLSLLLDLGRIFELIFLKSADNSPKVKNLFILISLASSIMQCGLIYKFFRSKEVEKELPSIFQELNSFKKYECVIGQSAIRVPVKIDGEGQTLYERSSLIKWLLRQNTSPMTRRFGPRIISCDEIEQDINKNLRFFSELVQYREREDKKKLIMEMSSWRELEKIPESLHQDAILKKHIDPRTGQPARFVNDEIAQREINCRLEEISEDIKKLLQLLEEAPIRT